MYVTYLESYTHAKRHAHMYTKLSKNSFFSLTAFAIISGHLDTSLNIHLILMASTWISAGGSVWDLYNFGHVTESETEKQTTAEWEEATSHIE